MSQNFASLSLLIALVVAAWLSDLQAVDHVPWAEIRVIDAESGHGVPLVELETVTSLKFVTDNAGRVAFHEPGIMNQELFFFVRSHGYEFPKDGFGYAGTRITPRVGQPAEIKLVRKNRAERLCRLTGEGRYRDTILLGHEVPLADSAHPGQVAGQDSVQAAIYRDKVYWFWGDTQRMKYPLGLFRVSGAISGRPDPKSASIELRSGIPYDYFVDPATGFSRAMMPLAESPEGVVWIFGVCVVPDQNGVDRLIGHYSRRKGLTDELEHGIATFNDDKAVFEPAVQLPLNETWRRPSTNPIRHTEAGTEWLLFGSPNPNVRVRANLPAVLDPQQYEAFTCAKAASAKGKVEPNLDDDGRPRWRWQQELPPTDSKQEQAWIKSGKLQPVHARYYPANIEDSSERVVLHSGSVRWNEFRQRWVLIAGQLGGKSSFLGEVWYAEAQEPTGPFAKAVRIVTHDRMTFYNVCHHDFLDGDAGRLIHFEGTYTNDFSGNPEKTARYNYNQVLYRLDLRSESLRGAFVE